jgi:glycolate oxidase FAD binding subunit
MPKLAVGSLGTLGVIVEATFKVAPRPQERRTLTARSPTLAAAMQLAFVVDAAALAVEAIVLRSGAGGTTVSFAVAGTEAAVARTRSEIEEAAGALDEVDSASWQMPVEVQPGGVSVRVAAQPSRMPELCGRLAARGEVAAYPTFGIALGQLDGPADETVAFVEGLRQGLRANGGSVVVTSAPLEVKQRLDVWGDVPSLELMRQLKQQFDPKGTLNPGRFVGGI